MTIPGVHDYLECITTWSAWLYHGVHGYNSSALLYLPRWRGRNYQKPWERLMVDVCRYRYIGTDTLEQMMNTETRNE